MKTKIRHENCLIVLSYFLHPPSDKVGILFSYDYKDEDIIGIMYEVAVLKGIHECKIKRR